jgi:DNA-binding MarR family transcriptional regulator
MKPKWLATPAEPSNSLGELFDICSNRHKGNTESTAAFQSIRGRLTAQQQRVLNCIRNSEGLTCNEIAEKLGATPNEISGRCSELKRNGEIRKSGTRLTRSGNPAAILVVT